ncbi:hypothetical protein TrVE_jg3084 [Triparma verrucosa]|uniref:Uncharacterized protein n=1 Tax=Triparma verrucosa TaxID=1606542 RepID=A0A9W7B5W4_9STRA|nr:hypothetical protein TrVE_jg3084 [Triparma verrucosa]
MASSSFKMMMLMLLALLNPSSGFAFVVSKPFHPISVRSHTSTSQLLSGPDLNDLDSLEVVDANDLEDCKKVEDSVWRRGDLDGMDAPIDEGWRQTCESMIQTAATGCGVEINGITWDFAKITIEVPSTATSDDQSLLAREINVAFEDVKSDDEQVIDCLVKHSLEIRTPGSPNQIVTQKQFDAYKGFDVSVHTVDPFKSNRVIEGKLIGRDALDVKVNVKGRVVTVPIDFVKEVKLPAAKTEKGDPFN